MAFGCVRPILIVFGVCSFAGLLSFSMFVTADRLGNGCTPALLFLVNELTGAYSYLPLAFLVIALARRLPLTRQDWVRRLPMHLGASIILGVMHTSLMTLSRTWLYQIVGLGPYKAGDVLYRYLLEYQKQFLIYTAIAAVVHLVDLYRARQVERQRASELEVQAAQLRSRLAEARLQSLRSQLQPHFLFNTLNMISSTIYEDPEKADRMITRLSLLLRISLDQADRPKIRLEEELESLRAYLEIMRSRFPDRLLFQLDVDPQLKAALVPGFILQPLVENAVKHGPDDPQHLLKIGVRVEKCDQASIQITILDNGPGAPEKAGPVVEGYGLSSVRRRLSEMYGENAALNYETGNGGFQVHLRLPLETGSTPVGRPAQQP
jgi:two-component system LytT family sensor kinase